METTFFLVSYLHPQNKTVTYRSIEAKTQREAAQLAPNELEGGYKKQGVW